MLAMSTQMIDQQRWVRRPHFELFESYQHPWLDISTTIDATVPWTICSTPGGPSFFAASVFLALAAANDIEELRMRTSNGEVLVHDRIHAGVTVLRDDETFGFGFIDHDDDFTRFAAAAAAEVQRVRGQSRVLCDRQEEDLIHFSILPWIPFTSVGHPRQRGPGESIPKIVLGRCTQDGSRWMLPVAVSAHHGLVDALHVARFLDALTARCADATSALVSASAWM